MKRLLWAACGLAIVSGIVWAQKAPEGPKLTTDKDKLSYSIGLNVGEELRAQKVEADPRIIAYGVLHGYTEGAKVLLTDEERTAAMTKLQEFIVAQQKAALAQLASNNMQQGQAFLAANAKKEGVKSTKSGLQVRVLKEGTGKAPGENDTVVVHYHGTTIEGVVFDSSVAQKKPLTIPVKNVIPGWQEALRAMKVGSKWQLVIPSSLAYGEQGFPPRIGPNQVLVFEVELLEVKS